MTFIHSTQTFRLKDLEYNPGYNVAQSRISVWYRSRGVTFAYCTTTRSPPPVPYFAHLPAWRFISAVNEGTRGHSSATPLSPSELDPGYSTIRRLFGHILTRAHSFGESHVKLALVGVALVFWFGTPRGIYRGCECGRVCNMTRVTIRPS